ncbi:MAG: hypothetical protein Q9217_006589 [Psora testacea]
MNGSNSSFDISRCARPNILALEPYRCARDDYKDDGTHILLDANENAYGPALNFDTSGFSANGNTNANTSDLVRLNRYPDPHQTELKQLLCKLRNTHHHTSKNLTPENLFVGVGSDEVIDALLRCFCIPGKDKVLTCPPTYGMYAVSAQVNDLDIVKVPLDIAANFKLRPQAIEEALSADPSIKIIYICSPGNPTAKLICKSDIQQLLEHCAWQGVVVVDEAYIDFSPEGSSLAEWVTEWPNLVVMQTLSKAFGLAGIRLGAAFTSSPIASLLNNLKAPYNISSPTSALACAALQPQNLALMRGNRQKIVQQRDRMMQELPKISGVGSFLGGADSNFLLVEILDKPRDQGGKPDNKYALVVYELLAETKGVVVRFRGKEAGCSGCLRITVGTEREVDQLLQKMRTVLGELYKRDQGTNNALEEGHQKINATARQQVPRSALRDCLNARNSMVKAETLPDYYGDLQLKPGAEPNEVKKQYKKLAFKYHPDRNPGHEAEYAAKFQAIQSANEVLTDPAQRAKYDAQRIRHGLFNSHVAPPPRPNVPPRTQTTHFPPPPRAPPPSASRPNFSPPRTARSKYSRFAGADTGWGTTSPEDAKSKTNDFKAWEQMRHGYGPIPPRRAPPPKVPRPPIFETGRTSSPGGSPPGRASNALPKFRRGAWEELRDAGMPNLSRAYTTRAPPTKASFVQSPPERDEKRARSSYFNISKGERPPAKTSNEMPPPPPRVPTSKKPDPPAAYPKHPLATSNSRVSTPYHAQGGEKTFLGSQGLQRPTTNAASRDNNGHTGWYENEPVHLKGEQIRATSASAASHDSLPHTPDVSSSSTTGSSSSDEEEAEKLRPGRRGTRVPKSRKARMPAGSSVRQRSAFSPHVRAEDAEDEAEAPHTSLNTSFRRRSGIDLRSQPPSSNQPEGFMEHRMKHDASESGVQSTTAPLAPHLGERFMQRHKSFDDKYISPTGSKSSDCPTNGQKGETPIYAKSGYTPFSFPFSSGPPRLEGQSHHCHFGSSKSTRSPLAGQSACWPYWAIPSSLPPIAEADGKRQFLAVSPVFATPSTATRTDADVIFASFHRTREDTTRPFAAPPPPLRSQSSDTINMKFSPSDAPPKFGGDTSFYPPPPSSDRPCKSSTFPLRAQLNQDTSPSREVPGYGPHIPTLDVPPPPKGPSKYSSEDWDKQFGAHTFEPPLSGSSSRTASRKRAGTPRIGSLNNLKRPGTTGRAPSFQATVVDDSDEPPVYNATPADNLNGSVTSSRVSTGSDGSAMDIDSSPPAPDSKLKTNGDDVSPSQTRDLPSIPRFPPLPPRADIPSHLEPDSQNMNFAGFQNVAPFAPSNEGLDNVDELKTALPFASHASATKPNFENCTKKLELPKVPKTPTPPSTLTQTSWQRYLADMNAYIFKWNTFSAQILLLFQNRQEEHREIGPSWVGQVGGDVDAYLMALDEDERARNYWEVASERHRECFQTLKKVRGDLLKKQGAR